MSQHPSDNIAEHIDALFVSPTSEVEEKTAALKELEDGYQSLALLLVKKACSCADRESALSSLRASFLMAVSAVVHELVLDPTGPAPGVHSPAPND